MGNRAVISFGDTDSDPVIYLHWNGGKASVKAFLQAAKSVGITYTTKEETLDKIAQLLATCHFQTEVGQTVYRMTYEEADTDNGDNGVYLIDENLDIVGRLYHSGKEEIDAKKTKGISATIVERFTQNSIQKFVLGY